MGLAKIAGYRWNEIKLSCFVFYSFTGWDKTSSLLGRGKRWVSFLAVNGYFVNLTLSLSEKPLTCITCMLSLIASLQCCIVEQAITYTNLDMARKHVFIKKVCLMKRQSLRRWLCTSTF